MCGETKKYNFYGWERATMPPASEKYSSVQSPREMYDILSGIWCAETCAPRLREDWSADNITLGQCSITAFLAQDVFGGRVYGILRPGGNYHCYNVVEGVSFDLTSEQFGDEAALLNYECERSEGGRYIPGNPEQFRRIHFAREEKLLRYERLKREFDTAIGLRNCN